MGHIFYLIGLIVFLINVNFLSNFFKYYKLKGWVLAFQKVTGKYPTTKEFKTSDIESLNKFDGVLPLTYFLFIIGILTSSWKIFLSLLIFNTIINFICKRLGLVNKVSQILQFITTSVNSIFILILIINHFHLHLDIFDILARFLCG